MHDAIEQAVERVISKMRVNLGEEISVDDMARVAMFSKFHFSRMFQRVTGVSPGRFLSALRLQQAKQLLVSTTFNVADISIQVGYNSVGTFSSRFTRSVGLSPTAYRRLGGFTPAIVSGGGDSATGVVSGRIWTPPTDEPQRVFVGLFPSRIPEGRPARCAILNRPGHYVLDKVPEGVWYVLSQSVTGADQAELHNPSTSSPAISVANFGPIRVGSDTVINTANLHHRPMRPLDPPVLIALLDVHAAIPYRTGGRQEAA